MKIYGLNKTTLLDYPGRMVATIFWAGAISAVRSARTANLVLNPPHSRSSLSQKFYPF